jgi:Ca2+-binding EF-hand superfamily protein
MQDYEDLLSKIMMHVKQQGLELDRIFNIFCKQGSFISYSDLKKILDLIEFEYSDNDFDMIVNFQDENDSQTIHAYEFLS